MSKDEPLNLREVALAASDRNGGLRGRGLQRVAEEKGLSLSYTTVDKMIDGTYKSKPKAETLKALAQLSGFTLEQVYRAATVPLPLRPLAEDLPEGADSLTGPQRRAVLDVIHLFALQNQQLADAGQSEGVEGHAERPAAMKQGLELVPPAGPLDEDLDDLPDEREEAPPVPFGRSAAEAARASAEQPDADKRRREQDDAAGLDQS